MSGARWRKQASAVWSRPALPICERAFDPPLVIGVIADTHARRRGLDGLPPQVIELFRRFTCGLILHAGDIEVPWVLEALTKVAPVLAVQGNNDVGPEIEPLICSEVRFTVGRFSFAMLHGHGGRSARFEARRRFAGKVDLVIYGHSHIPMIERDGGTTLFNPGSATDRRWHEHFGVGIITVTAERCQPELVLYRDPRDLENLKP